jgi:hypothetical protein
MENPAEELYSPASSVGTNAAKRVIVALMADKETIQRKRERLAAETYEYFLEYLPGANSTMEAGDAHAAAVCLARPCG